MDWWRCYHNAPFDPKWRTIAARAGAGITPCEVWGVASALCDRASQNTRDRGNVSGYDEDDIASGLGIDLEKVARIIDALVAKKWLQNNRIASWDKHQPKREDDTATQRKRDQRERERLARDASADDVTEEASRHVTQGHDREEKNRKEKKVTTTSQLTLDRLATEAGVSLEAITAKPAWMAFPATLHEWQTEKGFDPELDVWPTIKRVMATRNGELPGSPRYFAAAISQAKTIRCANDLVPAPLDRTTPNEWRQRLDVWKGERIWSNRWGPPPDHPETRVPPEILNTGATAA